MDIKEMGSFHTPILTVYGDYFEGDKRWTLIRKRTMEYFGQLRKSGGLVDILDLPKLGLYGISHMMMMDRNNREIVQLIQDWLVKKNLYLENKS